MDEGTDTMSSLVHKEYGCSEVQRNYFEYEWIIKDFSLFPHKNGRYVFSPIFHMKENDKVKWRLQLFPKGLKEDSSDFVSLFLFLHTQDSARTEIRVQCDLSIFKSESIKSTQSFTYTYEKSMTWGYAKMIERSKLLNSCGSDDSIIIRCKGNMVQGIITKPMKPLSFDLQKGQLGEHFSQLFQDLRFCDVTIIVGREKFPAHKVVLAARSPVFSAMFEHKEMEETRKNEVKIKDLEAYTVRGMLEFLYTDQVKDLETLAIGLLRASDKYELSRLRIMCEEVIYKTLSKDNAAEILVLSDLHHSKNLKEHVMAFIDGHLLTVMQSESYRRMVKEYPALVNELMYSIATRRKSKG